MTSDPPPTEKDRLLARLLAQLATARAGVFTHLLSLGTATLIAQPIGGDWTPKDTLAHLAFWDDFRTQQLAQMLAGQADQVDTNVTDTTANPVVYAERRDWPLEQVLDRVQAARARFLALLRGLADDDLARSFELPDGSIVTVRGWIERRSRHDGLHTAPIREWRRQVKPYEPGPRCLLVLALEAVQAATLAWEPVLTETELTSRPLIGSWTYQDALGHTADWEDWFVRGVRDMAAGQIGGSDFERDYVGDFERWNDADTSARRGEPYAETRAAYISRRQDLLALLQDCDDNRLAAPVQAALSGMDCYYFWFAGAVDHDFEHAEQIASALTPG